jgi:ABC-2 type transport system ATP-binding protein
MAAPTTASAPPRGPAQGPAQEPAIVCRGLRKVYEPTGFRRKRADAVVAVDSLDLEIRRGECYGLLGPNGAGKTTTVEILEGLLAPTAGVVELLGLTWAADELRLRQRIGVALQETRFPDRLSVQEILELFCSFYPRARPVDDLLNEVELQEKRRAWVSKLSGGQRQRLAVACALAGEPEILFLDEPTTGLDPQSRRQLWDLIATFRARGGTALLTTHYMEEAERLCDRVAIVDHGKIIREGSPRELIAGLGAEHVIEFELEGAAVLEPEALNALTSVTGARPQSGHAGTFSLTAAEPHRAVPALVELVQARGLVLARLATRHATLEDVFVALTGRQLRDA